MIFLEVSSTELVGFMFHNVGSYNFLYEKSREKEENSQQLS